MVNQKKAYLFAGLALFFWATVASAFKIALQYLSEEQLLLISSFTSFLLLFIILIITKKSVNLKSLNLRDLMNSAILGFLNPFLYYLILFKAYNLLSAQEALTLNYTWAIMIVILSILILKQKIALKSVFALLISFFGVIVIATRGEPFSMSFSSPLGVFLAAGSSIVWALYWLFNMKDKREESVKLFLNFGFGTIYVIIYFVLFTNSKIPGLIESMPAVYVGIFEMGLTFFVWLKALSLSETTAKVSSLIYLTPFLSLILIAIIIGEKILISSIAGLALILGGILLEKRISFKNNTIAKDADRKSK